MKSLQECLREFEGLVQSEQPSYLIRHGAYLTTNTLRFPDIPFSGATMTTHGGTLNGLYGLRERSENDMKSYTDEVALCVKMMLANYGNVDDVAKGDGTIIALAGVKATSTNTTRTEAPSTPANIKYAFVDNAGEIQITCNVDKLAWGSVIVTFTDPTVIVEKTGTLQLKVTTGLPGAEIIVLIDLSTTARNIIQHLKAGLKITSKMALFNPNGFSPLGGPPPIIVPR